MLNVTVSAVRNFAVTILAIIIIIIIMIAILWNKKYNLENYRYYCYQDYLASQ